MAQSSRRISFGSGWEEILLVIYPPDPTGYFFSHVSLVCLDAVTIEEDRLLPCDILSSQFEVSCGKKCSELVLVELSRVSGTMNFFPW